MYKIIRFYSKGNKRIIERGLTYEEAKAHCEDPKTEKKGIYFDGFAKE